jgi:hypothetical protein
MKSIIIFKEKYGNRYFDASTEKLRNAACLKILKERFEGFWYDYSNEKPSDKNILSDEQIAQLPTENLKTQESRKRKDYLKDLREYDDEVSFHKKAKLAIDSQDSQSAYYLLLQRDDGEYEGFDIEDLKDA